MKVKIDNYGSFVTIDKRCDPEWESFKERHNQKILATITFWFALFIYETYIEPKLTPKISEP